MPPVATAAVALAAGLDLAIAEPPVRVHPVAALGRLLAPLDRQWSSPRLARLVGTVAAAVVPLSVAFVAGGATLVATGIHPVVGGTLAALVLFSATSRRMLVGVASHVVESSATDPQTARAHLPALAGRDPAGLTPGDVRSAAVESAAENLGDGLVGPLLAFALLAPVSLSLAAAGAAWVKAVNTMDSMLGYPEKPVGWASARLDDVVMWAPARLAAVLVAVVARSPGSLLVARRWAGVPASPNAGWPMATLAVVLDVRLAKPGSYVLNEDADQPTVVDGRRGVRIVGIAGGLAFVGAGVLAWV